eukprot:TRINITY_DN3701_c0_g1_i13.p4 TRINITY_DN3701_c0_g1~~TRINITY_DN3701_c0_g1_i13.p4  ORF type:complete len:205 (+),score=-2.66 TRINITY_DN3701_c0_g1_i13:569-1183(+)
MRANFLYIGQPLKNAGNFLYIVLESFVVFLNMVQQDKNFVIVDFDFTKEQKQRLIKTFQLSLLVVPKKDNQQMEQYKWNKLNININLQINNLQIYKYKWNKLVIVFQTRIIPIQVTQRENYQYQNLQNKSLFLEILNNVKNQKDLLLAQQKNSKRQTSKYSQTPPSRLHQKIKFKLNLSLNINKSNSIYKIERYYYRYCTLFYL